MEIQIVIVYPVIMENIVKMILVARPHVKTAPLVTWITQVFNRIKQFKKFSIFSGDVATFKCSCQRGFTGSDCAISPCDYRPCKNDGECFEDASQNEGYFCTCKPGYFETVEK